MVLEKIFTPKIRIGIVHVIFALLLIEYIFIPFIWDSEHLVIPYNIPEPIGKIKIWDVYKGITLIILFYFHTFVLLPILLKKLHVGKYIILTTLGFVVATLVLEMLHSGQYTLILSKLNQANAFTITKEIYISITIHALKIFYFFFMTSLTYSFLTLKKEHQKKLLSLNYKEIVINFILVTGTLFFVNVIYKSSTILFFQIVCISLFYLINYAITQILKRNKDYDKILFLIVGLFIFFILLTRVILHFFHLINADTKILSITLVYLLLFILSFVYSYIRLKLKSQNIQLGTKDSELKLLKSQVNPHFLFNTLNTLYATALEENASKTGESIAKLASLIRYMQEDITKDFIPLENEIKYLLDYIAIQKLRCEVTPTIETNFAAIKNHLISPGLLIPFVENAFKYGIDPSKPSKLSVAVVCTKHNIHFECVNSYDDDFNPYYKEQGFGIGIKNAKQRLELVYPKRHTFEINTENYTFSVKITITTKEK
tara:strand:- start:78551 stop:80008 length:1458 start_codon:yes stop_codon:yes gene_type:complete